MQSAERRRVVVIHPSDEMYGADKVLLETLLTVPDDVEVQVWLPTDIDYPRRELSTALHKLGINTRHVKLPILRRAYMRPAQLPGLIGRFFSAALLLTRARPDLVYINTAASASLAPVSRLLGARVVLHLHEYIDGKTRITLPFVAAAHRIIAVSEAITAPLSPRLRRRTVVVHNGFDLAEATPLPSMKNGIVLVVASRWNAWKGHDVLIAAWNKLQRTDLHLRILGAAPLSGESIDVPLLVAQSRHPEQITIVGHTNDVRSEIDAAHVVLVPSSKPDPLPTIAIEALAAGRLLVGSNAGGLPEIAGDVGILAAPGDVEGWASALECLTNSSIVAANNTARARFEANFSQERFAQDISRHLWEAKE